ncbi:MAG TPA: penicillin-binding protein 2 [Flavisolibacter sp.]
MFNQSRSYIIRLIFIVAFLVILIQLFNLQVLSGKYRLMAEDNAVLRKTVYPARGVVFDREGRPLVTNTLLYDLMVTPSEMKNVDTAYLCMLLEINEDEFRTRVLNAILKNGRYRPTAFESLLTQDKTARLEENMWRLGNGFFLQERPIRQYPFHVGAHFMGYIGEVDSAIIARSNGFYQSGDYVGRSGLEATYEKILMGQRGVQYLIKDNKNRIVGSYEKGKMDVSPIAGRALHTYVDADVQKLAEKLMANKVGAAVAIDPKTGGIIAMVSGPTFDPNDITGSNFRKTYSKFVLDVSRPLLNRAIKGQYPPGSTFKPIGGLVALDEGVITPSFGLGCAGRYYGCGHGKPACTHKNPGHARNLRIAIANSCNSYFSHIYRLSVDHPKFGSTKNGYQKWKEYQNIFSLGVRTGIDLPGEDKGNIPDSSVYNKEYRNVWNSCTNLTLGIGQDKMTATPLQLANAMCIIANKGYYYTPHFVKDIAGETPADTILNKFRVRHDVLTHISDTAFEAIISGMQDVVEIGTARVATIPGINVCAKTGTAENKMFLDGKVIQLQDHSLFVCFAPREDPKIAVAVIVENAGFGSTWAGPIARLMMEKYLNDTLQAKSVQDSIYISGSNLMPSWLPRVQFKEDSVRAYFYFNLTKDSSYIRKYLRKGASPVIPPQQKPRRHAWIHRFDADDPRKNDQLFKRGAV